MHNRYKTTRVLFVMYIYDVWNTFCEGQIRFIGPKHYIIFIVLIQMSTCISVSRIKTSVQSIPQNVIQFQKPTKYYI